MPSTSALQEPTLLETAISFAGMIGLIAVIILVIILVFKIERIKGLQTELEKLQRAFNELDGQAKLIVQTDLELHRAQEELDKKIAGLVTLQKLIRLISSTLDEAEIFNKIEEKHITELGFDRAAAFLITPEKSLRTTLAIGYSIEDVNKIAQEFAHQPLLIDKILNKNNIFSSLDQDKTAKEIPRFLKLLGLSSFICAPIMQKNGAIGALILGSESTYTQLTEGDKDLVYILATQIGQVMENAKLFEETWRSHQELEQKIKQRTKELSEALEAIKTISKRKSDFISAVSHELRTPLTSIKGYASILAMGKLGELPPNAKQRVEKINKHSDNLSQLINNLLDISRIESGRQELKLEPVDLKNMAESLGDMLGSLFKEKGLGFITDISPEVPSALADKGQLERVFINLVGNALKFTPQGGKITIKAKLLDANTIQVSVSDTGLGIAEKDLTKIFDEFYRVDNDENQKLKGTGLGLSLVKYIVEAHKGKLSVSSQLNYGSTFTFTIPKA
ncbi:MAG: ATP-binding protein [Candidatus Omnitrophota bacterium]